MTASPLPASRLPVGSSASSTAGRESSARAMATRCRSPPESRPGRRAALSASPTRSSASRARARSCAEARAPARPAGTKSPGSMTFSTAGSAGSRLKDWKTKPTDSLRKAARSPGVEAAKVPSRPPPPPPRSRRRAPRPRRAASTCPSPTRPTTAVKLAARHLQVEVAQDLAPRAPRRGSASGCGGARSRSRRGGASAVDVQVDERGARARGRAAARWTRASSAGSR